MEVKRIRIDKITIGTRFRKELGDLKAFAEKIKLHKGLLQPIIVSKTKDGYKLEGGLRRLKTYRDVLGESTIDAVIVEPKSRLESLLIERDENNKLEPLPSEMANLGAEIERLMGDRQGKKASDIPPVVGKPQVEDGKKTREIAAELAGFGSEKNYRDAKSVVINGDPSLIEAMDEGVVSITDAAAVAKESSKVQKAAVKAVESGKARTVRQAVEKKAGKVVFDDRKFETLFGALVRFVDSRAKAYGKHAEYTNICTYLEAIIPAYKRWMKATT